MITKKTFLTIMLLVAPNLTFAKSDNFVEIKTGKYCWVKPLNKVDLCYKKYFSAKQVKGMTYINIKNNKQLDDKGMVLASKSSHKKIEIFKTPVINYSKVAWGFGINKQGIFGRIIF